MKLKIGLEDLTGNRFVLFYSELWNKDMFLDTTCVVLIGSSLTL